MWGLLFLFYIYLPFLFSNTFNKNELWIFIYEEGYWISQMEVVKSAGERVAKA
mgnify:CR=1 FL=1